MTDALLAAIEVVQNTWDISTSEQRRAAIDNYVTANALAELSSSTFESLPEVLQLILAMQKVSDENLNQLAIKEGYLGFEVRAFLPREAIIYMVAGAINRGSTATKTSLRVNTDWC